MREWETVEGTWSARGGFIKGDHRSVGADREGGGELIHESLGWHLGNGGLAACFTSPVVMQAPVVSAVVVRCWT